MASARGLAPTLRPLHRRSKAVAFFARRARRIAAALQTTAAPEALRQCREQLRQAKARVEGAAKAEEAAGLAFVLPEYAALGAGELPSRRAQRLRKGVRARSARAAVLWRFRLGLGFANPNPTPPPTPTPTPPPTPNPN